MAYDDVITRNDSDELAVRVVSSTESATSSSYDDVFTRDTNGKLAVRVVGAGGGGGGDVHNKGYFATPTALREAYPTAEPGDFAIVESTDTVWVWDSDTNDWKDGDTKGQVTSVNNQTGAVTLTASDVGALPDNTHIPADPVQADWDESDSSALDYIKNKPTIPAAQVNSDWDAVSGVAQILNKPTIPTVGDGTITITQGGVTKGTFTTNQSGNTTIDVDAGGGSGLPDQTGQSGKFLTTNGTDASWATINALQNTATSPSSLTILGNVSTVGQDNLNIGQSSTVEGPRATAVGVAARSWYPDATALGCLAKADKEKAIAIGSGANVSVNGAGTYGIAIGYSATVTAGNAIQIGGNGRTNSESGTLCIGSGNNNYKLLDSDGTIPADRFTTTPVADGTYVPTLTISSGVATRSWGAAASAPVVPATMPTLAVADWSSNTQTVNVTGVTASNIVFVSPAPASAADYAAAGIVCTAQGSGTLTFTCTTVPSNAITVNVVILG